MQNESMPEESLGNQDVQEDVVTNGTAVTDEVSQLDTIREILFGQQSRSRDQQLQEMEDRLNATLQRLEQATNDSFDRVNETLNQINQRLNERIDEQVRQRDSEFRILIKDIQDVTMLTSNLHQEAIDELRSVESAAAEATSGLQADMHEQVELLYATLEEQFNKLNVQKADRNSLASLLNSLAVQLTSLESNPRSGEA